MYCREFPYMVLSLNSHVGAIRLPEAAYRRLGHPALAAVGLGAAHFEHRLIVACTGNATLNEAADATVFHRDVTGGPHQASLLKARQAQLRRIVGEAQI